jgi:hypothetical protein
LLGESGENIRQCLNERDPKTASNLGVPFLEIILEKVSSRSQQAEAYNQEIVQLAGVLHTGWSTADDNHVHQSVDLFLGLILESGRLDTLGISIDLIVFTRT